MNIYEHCILSVKKFGGEISWYQPIHSFIDSSKYYFPDFRHRILLHNTYGVSLCVDKFGEFLPNGVLVRDVGFEHCKEDLSGKCPTLLDWYNSLKDSNISFEDFKDKLFNSDFGNSLGLKNCNINNNVQTFLKTISFKDIWCYKVNKQDLHWLKSEERYKLFPVNDTVNS